MIKVAICDDEQQMTTQIEELVIRAGIKRGVRVYTDIFFSAGSLMDYIRQGNEYDIIYLDIEMPQMDGIEFAKKLREMNSEAVLVYISAHTEYAIQLFDVDTFRFLQKPVDEDEFGKVFHQACDRIISGGKFFSYSYQKRICRVRLTSILYFESKGRTIQIVTTHGRESFYGKLDQVEEKLSGETIRFLRIHKSFLVNLEQVEALSHSKVRLTNGEELRISEERQKLIQRQYLDMEDW